MTKEEELTIYIVENDIENVKILLNDKNIIPSKNSIRYSSENGYIEILKLLLKNKNINPSSGGNMALLCAAKYGHADIVEVLLKDPRIDPNKDFGNWSIIEAASNGHHKVIEVLLKDPRTDPTHSNNISIRKSHTSNFIETYLALWKDKRVRNTLEKDLPDLYNELIEDEIKNKLNKF
jgi:ankyrin repeat protein